tara:strand:- start:2474 stop:2605 length:132 start_codon:yes stop_codon:yes gene_type:complete
MSTALYRTRKLLTAAMYGRINDLRDLKKRTDAEQIAIAWKQNG